MVITNQGSLKTLVTMLQQSSYLTGISVGFGEEFIKAQEEFTPYICIVPKGGPWELNPGYAKSTDPNVTMLWGNREELDVYCWAVAADPNAPPIDHADAVENLVACVLCAFQDQRAIYNSDTNQNAGGVWYKAVRGQWSLYGNALIRYGRAYILSVVIEKTVSMLPPQEATVTSETINESITPSAS